MKIGCVLLAAGSGKRFGGDKLLYAPDGVSMAERACRLHADIDYGARVMVVRTGDETLGALAAQYGFDAVPNPRAADGIGTSAACGMAALLERDGSLDGALFAVCDQPYLTAESVRRLLQAFQADASRIVAPECLGRRGNPVVFPRSLFREFDALHADVGGGAIIRNHPELLTLVALCDERELSDIDYQNT